MKKYVTREDFIQDFIRVRPDNFSRGALNALFDYFEQFEDDTGEEIDFDVIAICCDFSEYKDLKEFQDDYGTEYKTIEDIREETSLCPKSMPVTVIEIPDTKGFIIQAF